MKKFLTILLAFTSIFFINSCQEDGDWENGEGGQFGFKIERDTYFIEKSVGEANQLKFNVIPNYVFSTVPMKFKFTSTLNGTLTLGTQNLSPNVEYTLTNKENIFKYVGNVSGTHDLTIVVSNDKGVTKEEKFTLEYAISEFTHTYTGGTADIYQSDETPYIMKIVPASGQPSTGYEIKFNSYNGNIKLNGVAAQTGQYYPLPNIDNFNVILATNQVGQGALSYSIKNSTVTKDYTIQQTIKARQIVIESMNINSQAVTPNSQMSLVGVVKKSPITPNTSVSYKTWISSASNNNMSGIQNTNNIYVPYSLTPTGSFSYNFNSIEAGTYTYNIQFKDEFGNESTVKSFTVDVQSPLQFVGTPSGSFTLGKVAWLGTGNHRLRNKEYIKNFKVVAGGTNSITQIKYEFRYTFANTPRIYNDEENFTSGSNTVDFNNVLVTANSAYLDIATITYPFSQFINPIIDGTLKITVFASNGNSITQTVPVPINIVLQ